MEYVCTKRNRIDMSCEKEEIDINTSSNLLEARIYKKLRFFDLDMDLNLKKEVLVIQGHSGSGKTTLLNCISGIAQPDKGFVNIESDILYSDEKKINKPIRDRNIGYMFQNYALFPNMTVEKNLIFGINKKNLGHMKYLNDLMEIFKISHLKNRYPGDISGGEKQRVALARSLTTRPKVMLMDEPFSALDTETKDILYREFLEFKKEFDIGVMLITHNDEEARYLGDRIIKIDNGKIISIEDKNIDW
ncbi:MAG: ATP-binding cassette domain-containing protein [Andreesenia angusta]|nr:ATP-binding cassette domain-containing protein [Andreesenia angusta]